MPRRAIQDLFGHKSIDSTDIYTKLSPEAKKREFDRYQ
jgi:site-specific recombinase XerD